MKSSTPNLFNFATSELSQDAFICWLASWANSANKNFDEALHNTSKYFLDRLFEKHGAQKPEKYNSIEVKKQDNHIDVLIIINKEFAIIVEDKVNTTNHSNQLKIYLDKILKKDFKPNNIIPIYLKTGDQSNYKDVRNKGYSPFIRTDFLNVLNYGKQLGVKNSIFTDYYYYLKKIDDEVNSYKILEISQWRHRRHWIGFYIELQKQLGQGDWSYIANPRGGFMGFWWYWKKDTDSYKYLQLEENKLCFRIEVKDKSKQSSFRNSWCKMLINSEEKFGLNIYRPSRLGKGTWMTAAILDSDYRQTDEDGKLDMEKTITLLRKAEKLLEFVLESAS